jgi:hypothetical protein
VADEMKRVRSAAVVAVLAMLAAGVAGCSKAAAVQSVAIGSVSCGHIAGSIVFTPALTTSGQKSETMDVMLDASECASAGSRAPAVHSATATARITGHSNACSTLNSTQRITVHVTWAPSTISPSTASFSGAVVTTDAAGHAGFMLPASSGTVVHGSFAAADGGATSTLSVFSSQAVGQWLSACESAGLSRIDVTSGSLRLG